MRNNNSHGLNAFNGSDKDKDRQILINWMRRQIENTTGYSVNQLKHGRTDLKLYRFGLFLFTTTNKAICKALDIPVEAGTRYKRTLEKEGHLVASRKKRICPYTKHSAHFLSTASNEFSDLLK